MNKQLHVAWLERFEVLEPELNQLDAATGDGDHGATMLSGLQAVAISGDNPAKAFRKAAGGASGTLFSILIGAVDKAASNPDTLQQSLPALLAEAACKISELGQAVAGDKTMLDALLPASCADSLHDAVRAAQEGYIKTESMTAKRGRARHVEGAGHGSLDAGARSVVEILAVLSEVNDGVKSAAEKSTNRGECQ